MDLRHKRLGQHFLTQGRISERIAAAACGDRCELAIEIGPGRGALTEKLLKRSGRLIAVELDPHLADYLETRFAGRVEVMRGDALTVDLAQWGIGAVAGNLPYYAATSIIQRVLSLPYTQAVFLIQKEVAERLTAAPGCREYGYLTVATQLFARVELLFTVSPGAFQPPPKVDSAVVRLRPRDLAAELEIADTSGFLRFASVCFRQKRKTLRNNLVREFAMEAVDSLPEASQRAEQLSIDKLAAIYRALIVANRTDRET